MLKEPRRVVEDVQGNVVAVGLDNADVACMLYSTYHKIVYSPGVYVCYTTLMLIVDYSLMETKLFEVKDVT